jgi:hypothetical protein
MAGHRHDEGSLALPIEPELRLVAQPGSQHRPVHVEEVLVGKAELSVAGARLLPGPGGQGPFLLWVAVARF